MIAMPVAKRPLWREQIFITLAFLLAAWLGVVHALAGAFVFVVGQHVHTSGWEQALGATGLYESNKTLSLAVATCKHRRLSLQTSRFSAQIN